MNPDPFEQLSVTERDELALCGISSAVQLCTCTPCKIAEDLKLARNFFPDRTFVLTEQRLQELSAAARTFVNTYEESKGGLPVTKGTALPTTGLHKHGTGHKDYDFPKHNHRNDVMLHSPVHSNHPLLVVLASLSTLLLLMPMISIVAFADMIITQSFPELPVSLPVMAVLTIALPCVPYLLFSRLSTCPVCHIRIYRFSHYSRHKGAHHLPLLGYNITMALHIIFRAFYVCPGCGTPVKLIGGHKPHSHH